MTTVLYVLDVEDFRPLAEVAAKCPGVTVRRRGPYHEVSSAKGIEIERAATGCRNAVWFSAVAAIGSGRITQWDKAILRIEPDRIGAPLCDSSAGDDQ
ncbi:hypothetical protein ACWZHB_12285 [Nocardia sp. FBN12]|uniref:hypothetical protein n=1 Tax=Nocardia sp. FBN12 TaxID=3419766 RepID=UPI003D055024